MKRLAATWRSWSLMRQLVVGVSAVVVIVVVSTGTASVLTLRQSVQGIIDAQLSGSADGFSQGITKYRTTRLPSGELPAPGTMKPLTHFIGQAPENVIALMRDGKVVDSAYFADGEARPAPPSAVARINALSWTDTAPRTVRLPGLDYYRISARPGDDGEVMVTAVSRKPAWDAVTRETAIVAGLTTVALLVAAFSTIAIVRFALRPLRRVSATAAEVASTPLTRDQHSIAPRVPLRDTDPSTEVGQVGDTLNQLLDHVERALADVAASDRRMRQFITDASHELRTPLAAIQGYAELTRQDAAVLPDMTEYSLARIEGEAQRMNALVSNLLLLARLDEGEDLDTTDVDIAEIVLDAVSDAAVSAPGHTWRTDVPDRPVWVRGDRTRMHQVIANLLSNAGVHTPPGTTVTASVDDSAPRTVELLVSDDGPGIAADLQPQLFERFRRGDQSRSRESGSFGLGLSIAASIVEAHGGTITVQCNDGRTVFRVRLPAEFTASSHHRRHSHLSAADAT